jgi:hypothetical protein
MRNVRTNVLQIAVLAAGIIYCAFGALYFIAPQLVMRILPIEMGEDPFNQIRLDELLGTIYAISRALAGLLFFAGASMVMPLFDPLKYRVMAYFFGFFFPAVAAAHMTYAGFISRTKSAWLLAAVFGFLALLNLAGLLLTRGNASRGVE